jgi:hypothetical protein
MSFVLGFQIDALTPTLLGPIQVGHVAALVGPAVGAAVVGDDVLSMSRAGSLMRGHLVECCSCAPLVVCLLLSGAGRVRLHEVVSLLFSVVVFKKT